MAKWNPVTLVLVITPLVIAPLLLFGVYFGYYLGGVLGYPKYLLAIVFSTAAFLVAIFIVGKIIVRIVADAAKG